MRKFVVSPNQSLFDVAVMAYGDVGGTAWLLADNPTLTGPTHRLVAGQALDVRAEAVNLRTRAYLEDYGVIATIDEADRPQGVAFWRLEEYAVAPPELNAPPPEPF